MKQVAGYLKNKNTVSAQGVRRKEAAIRAASAVALFHETERNLTKPSNYCRQMCYKNASNSNKKLLLLYSFDTW